MECRSGEVDERGSASRVPHSRSRYSDVAILTILLDACLVVATAAAVVHFLIGIPFSWLTSNTPLPYFQITSADAGGCLAVFLVALFAVAWHYGLYSLQQPRGAWNEQRMSLQACLGAGLLLCGTLYLSGQVRAPRSIIVLIVGATATVLGARRVATRLRHHRRYVQGAGRRRLLIAGENRLSESIRYQVERDPNMGYQFCGFLRVPGAMSDRCCPKEVVAGTIDDVERIARRSFIDEVIITEFGNAQQVIDAIEVARKFDLNLKILPGIHEPLTLHGPLIYLGNVPLVSLHRTPPPDFPSRLKGLLDVTLASMAFVACLPFMSVIAAALVLEGKGNVLTATECFGRRADPFRCYKFRTNSVAGKSGIARSRASRADSWVCGFLARTRLDGLPMLWNVLSGQMSFVGPRLMVKNDSQNPGNERPPLQPNQLRPEELRCLSVLPGLTGAWRVRGLRKGSFARSLAVDAKYVNEWSLWLDATILTRSIGYMLLGIGSGLGQAMPRPSTDVELS